MMRYFNKASAVTFLALGLLLLGAGLRLYDLTDQPMDFHTTRQLRSALVARNLYYQMNPEADAETRELAYMLSRSTGQYEPPVLETLVAWTYRLAGQEILWVSRLYTITFWMIGGLALFDLARRMTSGERTQSAWTQSAAALIALGYYLLLPFAVQASRSFQPDPGMVMWVILAANMLYRWSEGRESQWRWAILAGIFGGMAILTKVVAVYLVGVTALFLVIYTLSWRRFWRDPQVWVMAILMVTPTALFYLLGRQGRAAEYVQTWTISLSHLLLDPSLYARWFNLLVELMGLAMLVLGVIGVALAAPRGRALLAGLWIGYILYGLSLPYQMYTHTYYHLQLVPILALSLAPAAEALFEKFSGQSSSAYGRHLSAEWAWKTLALLGLAAAVTYLSMTSIVAFRQENFREDPAHWEKIGSLLPSDGRILGLTQEYGFPLAYYGWRKVTIWPILGERQLAAMRGEPKAFEDYFQKKSKDMGYFLITAFNQFNQQPDLKEYLYQTYPVFAEGDGYLIFDIESP